MDSEGDGPEERQLPFLTTVKDKAEAAETQPLLASKLFVPTYKIESKELIMSFSARACHGKAACVPGHLNARLPAPGGREFSGRPEVERTSGDCAEDICPWTWVWGS